MATANKNSQELKPIEPKALVENEGMVSISQAAKILDVSIDTVRRWDKQGIIKSTRPDGKNRYFAIKDLENIKFSQPLSISEVSEQLNVSPSTLRRLETKGLIKPERNAADERVYDRKAMVDFLQSQYFVRQKEVQEEILEPLNGASKDENGNSKGKGNGHHDPATHALLGEHHVSIAQLKKFRKIFLRALAIIIASFVIIIALLTLYFFLFPETASKSLGYYKKDPLGKHFIFQPQRSLFARQMKPFSQTSLRIVEAINPDLRKQVAPFGAIEDVNDVFQPDADGNVKSLYTFTVPDTSYLKIPDQGLVANLNSELLQGRKPGCEKGNLAIVGVCAGVTNTITALGGTPSTGGGTTVVNATSNTLSGDVTSVDAGVGLFGGGAEGAIKLRVELQSGSGMEATSAGLSLARSCGNNQLLKWNGFGWACASDDGGTPPDMFSTVNASLGTSPVADNPNDQLSLLGSGGLSVSGEAINDTITFGLDITVSGVTTTTSSISGLEISTDGLRLMGGCSNNQILKWTGAVWVCSADTGGIDAKENNAMVLTAASAVNYGGNDFVVTNAGGGQVDIVIDYPNSKITRSNQNETIAGAWTLQQTLTFSGAATDIDTASGEGLTLQGRASSSFVTTAGDINLNPSGSVSASVVIGGGASNNVDLLILDRKNDSALDPVGTAGAMYYNLAAQKFRCYQGSLWVDCVGAGGGGGGSSVWSSLTGPVAPLTLAHGEFPTTFSWSANNTLSANLDAFTLDYTNDGNSDPNTQRLLVLKNQNNGIVDAGSIKTETLLRLEHNDDSILDKGIQIISSASGPINTAIDVSDGGIGTALSIGNNNIIGTTPNITFDNLLFVGSIGYMQLGSSGWIDGANVLKLTSGTSINLDATNNNIIFADNDVFNIGGTSGRAYNSISGGGSANIATNDNDLYIEDILEVDGATNIGGNLTILGTTVSASSVSAFDCTDCLNYDDFSDSLVVDATTTTTLGVNSLVYDLSGTGNLQFQDGGIDFVSLSNTGQITLGKATADQSIDIGVGTGIDTINIGTGATGADVIQIGTGTAAKSLTMGTTNTSATTLIQAGSGDITLNADSTAGNIIFADTDTFAIGGVASGLAYNAISNALGSANGGDVTDDNDLYVQGALEIDGNFNIGGTTLSAVNLTTFDCLDCIDWDDIKDAMTLDAATTTTRTSTGNESSLMFNYINNGGTAGVDNFVSIVNAISSNTTGDLNTETLLLIDQADTTTTGNSVVDSGLLITNSGGSTLTNGITVGAGSQTIATGINLASTGTTTDIRLQNGETLDNDTDNQLRIVYGATGGSLLLQNGSNLVTDQPTFNLLNTAATTINFGGTATTALNIGSITTGVNNFAADTDWILSGSENLTVTNSSASTDQLSITATGVTTGNVDGLQITFGTATGAGANNSGLRVVLNGSAIDASDILNGIEVTGSAQTVASATQNLLSLIPPSSGNSAGTLNGLSIGSITSSGSANERGIYIGSGWDSNIFIDDVTGVITIPNGIKATPSSLDINDSTGNSLLNIRDLNTNFGGAVTAGAFIDRNSSYFDEFNFPKTSCTTSTALSRGDWGSVVTGATCGTTSSGELSFQSLTVGAGASCTASSPASINGIERIEASTTVATALSATCWETLGTGVVATDNSIYNAANLPVVVMKLRSNNAVSSSSRVFAGMGTKSTADTTGPPATGIYFSNCRGATAATPDCGTNLFGIVKTETEAFSLLCGAFPANQMMYLRIEVRATDDIHFYADLDTTNGIVETECGTGVGVSTTTPAGNMTLNLVATKANQSATNVTLDIDYFRSWQDDNVQPESGLSGENSTDVAIATQQITPTNRLTAFNLEDGSWVLGDSQGNQLAGVDIMGNATFKGEVTASGLNIKSDDGSTVANIDKSGNATLSAVDAKQVRADQVVASDIGQRYYTNDDSLENGDVVMLDGSAVNKVKKADVPNAKALIGVVTTGPSLLIDAQGSGASVVVAVAGQVAVKVSTQNGNINAGDMLTSSFTQGVAVKSIGTGPIIGRAVMGYSGEGVSSILVLVDNGVGIKDLTQDLNALSSRLDSLEQKFQTTTTGTQANGQDIDLSNLSVSALTVNLDMIVKGAMVVDGPATFKQAVRFERDAVFDGSVAVNGTITVNNNSAGYAKIATGEQRIQVIFSKPFANTPVVTVSLGDGKFTTYSYRNVSANGFEIILKDSATEDLTFTWTATSVNNPQTFVNSTSTP